MTEIASADRRSTDAHHGGPDRPEAGASTAVPGPGQARQLVTLLLVVAAIVVVSILSGTVGTVAVVASIIAIIMLHELGHFMAAKWGGMKVTEYFLGFGPRLWSVRRGETEYGVKALPLGGYVKIPGMTSIEEVDPADESRTYRQQSFPKRLAVAVAGSAVHFTLAFLIMMVIWTVVGMPNYERPLPVIGSISRVRDRPSPAQQGGLRVDDRIVAVDGRPVRKWDEVRPEIRSRADKPLVFTVERDGVRRDLTVVPTNIGKENEEPVGFIGVAARPSIDRVGPVAAVGRSAKSFSAGIVLTVKGLGSFFAPDRLKEYGQQVIKPGTGNKKLDADKRFLSAVDLVRVSGQAAESGTLAVLSLLFALNLGVGLFNMVPLLPLDGGHVAIAVYERIRSRKGRPYHADARKLVPVAAAVIGVLVVITVSSLILSFTQPLGNLFQ